MYIHLQVLRFSLCWSLSSMHPFPLNVYFILSCSAFYNIGCTRYCDFWDPCNDSQLRILSGERRDPDSPYMDDHLCDDLISSTWYKVEGSAVTTCPVIRRCGSLYPIWLNGSHPQNTGETVTRIMCVRGSAECCEYTYQIKIKLCSGFYAFCLPPVTICSARYCFSNDTVESNGDIKELTTTFDRDFEKPEERNNEIGAWIFVIFGCCGFLVVMMTVFILVCFSLRRKRKGQPHSTTEGSRTIYYDNEGPYDDIGNFSQTSVGRKRKGQPHSTTEGSRTIYYDNEGPYDDIGNFSQTSVGRTSDEYIIDGNNEVETAEPSFHVSLNSRDLGASQTNEAHANQCYTNTKLSSWNDILAGSNKSDVYDENKKVDMGSIDSSREHGDIYIQHEGTCRVKSKPDGESSLKSDLSENSNRISANSPACATYDGVRSQYYISMKPTIRDHGHEGNVESLSDEEYNDIYQPGIYPPNEDEKEEKEFNTNLNVDTPDVFMSTDSTLHACDTCDANETHINQYYINAECSTSEVQLQKSNEDILDRVNETIINRCTPVSDVDLIESNEYDILNLQVFTEENSNHIYKTLNNGNALGDDKICRNHYHSNTTLSTRREDPIGYNEYTVHQENQHDSQCDVSLSNGFHDQSMQCDDPNGEKGNHQTLNQELTAEKNYECLAKDRAYQSANRAYEALTK